jgi:hypothetical protein
MPITPAGLEATLGKIIILASQQGTRSNMFSEHLPHRLHLIFTSAAG